LPAAAMRNLIAALCTQRWLTSRELGALLQRDADNLQTRFLTAMVREGRLALRFPDVPNRPDQAYRSIDKTT
jgi:ATP-dependent DNA helicase RecG